MKVSQLYWTSNVTTRIQATLRDGREVDLTVATDDGSRESLLAEAEAMVRKARRLLRNAELVRLAAEQVASREEALGRA